MVGFRQTRYGVARVQCGLARDCELGLNCVCGVAQCGATTNSRALAGLAARVHGCRVGLCFCN